MWDYIVIGAGSGGCAVANRLSEGGRNRILLLEAGPHNRSMLFKAPAGVGLFKISRYDWGYHSRPDPTRNDRSEYWPRGRVLGGSSSINGMNYVRGSAGDFHRWADAGLTGWDANNIARLYKDLERCDPHSIPANDVRGRLGPVHVRMVKDSHPVTQAFIAAAIAAGHPFNPDYNGPVQHGVGYAQLTQHRGMRCSAADAFLNASWRRKNLKIAANAHVHRLIVQGAKVSGVLYEKDGSVHEVRTRRVILCAGAINTPQLLMLSGIGDAALLNKLGVAVALDSKSVGDNLIEHPLIRLLYRIKVPTYNLTGGFKQKLSFLAKYLFTRQGPLAACFESIAFLKTSPAEPQPDVQLHVAPLGFEGSEDAARPLVQMLAFPSMTVVLNKNHPVSRGRVSIASADPKAPPLIEPRLLASTKDLVTLARGIAMVRAIATRAPLAELIEEEVRPGPAYKTPESIESYLKDHVELAYHPVGTCRMGVDSEAVVTPDLRLRGLENLWIADASVMPDLISGNTNAACMMIGDKLGKELNENDRLAMG
jgi:choline dehydrogenase